MCELTIKINGMIVVNMKITIDLWRNEPEKPDFSKTNLEAECSDLLVDLLNLPRKTNIRFVDGVGVVMYYCGKVYLIDMEINLDKELKEFDAKWFGIE